MILARRRCAKPAMLPACWMAVLVHHLLLHNQECSTSIGTTSLSIPPVAFVA